MASRYLCAALLLLGSLSGVNYAKPPDLPQDVIDDCEEQEPIHRAGQIIIIGHHNIPQDVILEQVPIYPGQMLTPADLRQAEKNLQKLNVFENDPEGTGIVPRVEVLDPEGPIAYKDILITVQEKCCAELADDGKPKCSCETDCKCCGCKKCKDGEADSKCQCAAGECKCCGCKTVSAQLDSKVKYGCAASGCTACTASCCEVVAQACCKEAQGCCQQKASGCGNCEAKRVSPCSFTVTIQVADGEKNCKCEKDCKCCGCKDCKDGEKKEKKGCECAADACKCCGCKDKAVSTGCCTGCPVCADACNVTWGVLCEMFPPVKLAVACPKMAVKVHKIVKPAIAMVASQCRQVLVKKDGCAACGDDCECCEACEKCEKCEKVKKDCATGCAAKKSCVTSAGCKAQKVSKKGCTGGCGDAKAVKQWEKQTCPWTAGRASWVIWKNGNQWEQIAVAPCEVEVIGVMPQETPKGCPFKGDSKPESVAQDFNELGSPLENLEKLAKARHLAHKADHLWNKGDYDRAIRCYQTIVELVPGSRYDAEAQTAMQLAKAMKTVEDMLTEMARQADVEKAATEEAEPLPCKVEEKDAQELADFTTQFNALLEQARSHAAKGEHASAQELALQAATLPRPGTSRVSELMDAAKRSFAAGCHDDALGYVQQALMFEPACAEASTMQQEILILRGLKECEYRTKGGCEGYPTAPSCDEEPCEPFEGCPGLGFVHPLPGVDPAVARVMEKVLADLAAAVETCDDTDIRLYTDGEEQEELELFQDGCRDFPADAVQFHAQLRQVFNMLRQAVCAEVDAGAFKGVRLQVTMQTASGEFGVRLEEGQPVFCWQVIATPGQDVKAVTQAHYEDVLRWIESMNSGGCHRLDDSEEAEEPLFQLETDLDPCW